MAIVLDHDAAVLKMIESGNTSRLIWVGSTIEITAEPQTVKVYVVSAEATETTVSGDPEAD